MQYFFSITPIDKETKCLFVFGFPLLKIKITSINEYTKLYKFYCFGIKIFSREVFDKFDYLYFNRFDDNIRELNLKYLIREQYKRALGYYPNLDNPKTFNEKLAWEKLYYRNPLMTICADKVKAREYFVSKIKDGQKHLVKQIGIYDNENEIDFEKLPSEFVLKSNWGSGRQIIVRNKNQIDMGETKKIIATWLDKTTNHYYKGFEWGYKNIIPHIICEEFLYFKYKMEFFCFSGKPKFFWIILDDETKHPLANFYDMNFRKMNLKHKCQNFQQLIAKPYFFDTVVDIATQLSKGFPFVRCDFYITENTFYFCEMTFYHWCGLKHFEPKSYDKKFGDMFELPRDYIELK